MAIFNETFQADLRTSTTPETVFVIGPDANITTVFGTLDSTQGTFPTSPGNANTLLLDTTTLRADFYRIPLTDGVTYHIEIAIDGAFGGTLDDYAFTVSGDNGNSVNGQILPTGTFSLLAAPGLGTETFVSDSFTKGPHDNLYITVLTDSVDEGTYSLSVSTEADTLGDDVIDGTSDQDDILTGLRGDDTINGLDGTDTAQYVQADDVFTLRLGSEISIEDRGGNEGTDRLLNIENIGFSNEVFALQSFDDVASLTPEEFASFTEMYIAYFNRAPDAAGLMFWANAFATGTTIEPIARLFSESPEAQALYPADAAPAAFVEAIYLNVLGRTSDPAGANFWTSVLENGSVTRDEFVLQVLRGARADTPPDATQEFIDQQALDVAYLDNKIDIGIYFSAILGMSDVANANEVMGLYDGSELSIQSAKIAADLDFVASQATDGSGEFLIQLVGVVDDPFAAV